MLAGWLRLKYPHLIVAAVASSAPVRASAAMPGYDRVVGRALAEKDVGGSEACVSLVSAAFREAHVALGSFQGRRRLEKWFGLCGGGGNGVPPYPLEVEPNRAEFLASLVETIPAQSNDPACDRASNPACDIRGVCEMMTVGTDDAGGWGKDLRALARFAKVVRAAFGEGCLDVDHAENLRALNDTNLPLDWKDDGGDRAWFWQTCVEFGFYQTCDDASVCPFLPSASAANETYLTLDFFAEPCRLLFGLDLETITFPAADRSNWRTGGWSPGGSRVLYPSGSVDPWLANSFTPDRAGSVPHRREKDVRIDLPAFVVPGASHHAWTHPPRATDQASVVEAREAIKKQVDRWLDLAAETDVRVQTREE